MGLHRNRWNPYPHHRGPTLALADGTTPTNMIKLLLALAFILLLVFACYSDGEWMIPYFGGLAFGFLIGGMVVKRELR